MAKNTLPRSGSRAEKCLALLHRLHRPATVSELRTQIDQHESTGDFRQVVISRLRIAGLVTVNDDVVTITAEGRRFLGFEPPKEQYVGIPAAPRVGGVHRPLRSRSPMVLREGALDYRNIPSVMGGKHVPYKASTRQEKE